MTHEYRDRIAAAQARFATKTRGLKEPVLELALRGMANRPIGSGEGQIDPVEKALAAHSLSLLELRLKAERIKAEHTRFERSPPPNMRRGDYLVHLDTLERAHGETLARLITTAEDGFEREVSEAARYYAAADAEAQRVADIQEAAEAKAVELRAAANSHAVDMLARAIANKG